MADITEITREWLPEAWLDEVTPGLQAAPEVFAEQHEGGWRLIPPAGSGWRDEAYFRTAIEPGQVVRFFYREFFGEFVVTVREDRTWSASGGWPQKATHFWRDGGIFNSMEEAVNPEDWHGDPLEPGEHEIGVGFWSDAISFRFDVIDGKPLFTQVAGAN